MRARGRSTRHESAGVSAGRTVMRNVQDRAGSYSLLVALDPYGDGLTLGNLGLGWEEVDRALADIQADLSRTVTDSPTLVLLWRELDADRDGDDALAGEYLGADARRVFVGKGQDWYYGSDGGVALVRDYPSAVMGLAEQVSDAIADTLLGYYAYWPHCPADDHPLTVHTDVRGRCWWVCIYAQHIVDEVGRLRPLP